MEKIKFKRFLSIFLAIMLCFAAKCPDVMAETKAPTRTTIRSITSPGTKKVKITWKKISRADKYQIQLAKNRQFTRGKLVKTVSAKKKSVTFSGLAQNKRYYGRVRAYRVINGKKYPGKWSRLKSIYLKDTDKKEPGKNEAADFVHYGTDMPKDKITLCGDENFKQEILKGSNNTISSNALYVSPDGDDRNSGDISNPFHTIQKALNVVSAGETIYLRNGTYTGSLSFKKSGTAENYITLRNYPGEKPYLTMKNGANGAILRLAGHDYIKIEGLEIGGFSSVIAQGILLDSDENHVIIRNNQIHDLKTTKPKEGENGEANAILCYGEKTTDKASIHNICIENNNIYNNTTGWCEVVSVAGNAKYVNIINNTVHDNTNIGIDFYGNAGYCKEKKYDQPRYCVAAGNLIYKSVCNYAQCAGLYVDGARDVILENNIIHSCMYGIEIGSEELQPEYPVKNITVRNNLVYDNPDGGIRIGGYDTKKTGWVTAAKIYNNTMVNNGSGEGGQNGELCFAKCNGIIIKNNILYKDSQKYPLIGEDLSKQYVKNVTFCNNIFYSPAGAKKITFHFGGKNITGIASFQSETKNSNTFGKPDFNKDYSLKSGSCGIDMGDDVTSDIGLGLDLGNHPRIIGIIDAGAFEYPGQ